MKQTVLFMVINMNVGGTEKALLNMIAEMPEDQYDITILMLEKYGGFLNSIPKGVKVKYVDGYEQIKSILNMPPKQVVSEFFRKGQIFEGLNIAALYLFTKLSKDPSTLFKSILKDTRTIEAEYDVAIAYAGPMDFISYFVLHKINAKKRVQWVHFDIERIGFNAGFASKVYKKFEKVFVVSEEGKNKLTKALPGIKGKTESFLNIISAEFIANLAQKGSGFEDNYSGTRVLTVGRLSKEKGQDLTIPVLARLKAEGYDVRWYCIGDGNARKDYEKLIGMYRLEKDYILLGANANPYPFMKQCDIYVQPSRHEGFCITLAEARCFDNPIITTNFTGASEQIKHEETGLIVEANEEQIYAAVKRLLVDKRLREKLHEQLQNETVDTTREVEKLKSILKLK